MPEISIVIDKDGNIVVDAKGYAGKSCLKELEDILAGMSASGVDVSDLRTELKSEAQVQTERQKEMVDRG